MQQLSGSVGVSAGTESVVVLAWTLQSFRSVPLATLSLLAGKHVEWRVGLTMQAPRRAQHASTFELFRN